MPVAAHTKLLEHHGSRPGDDNRTAIAAATKIGDLGGGYGSAILSPISPDLELPATNPPPILDLTH